MKNKFISIILTLILCFSTVLALVSCNDKENEEKPSDTESEVGTREEETLPPPLDIADIDDLSYVLTSDEKSYSVYGLFHKGGAKKIVIPSEYDGLPVTAISESAFSSCEPLEEVVIPDSVTHIGSYAFDGCINLNTVDMSSNLVYVGDAAFDGCDSLPLKEYRNALYLGDKDTPYIMLMKAVDTEIESCAVHDDTKIIYDYAFLDCTEIDEIIIPSGIKHIGSYAFENCYDLFPSNSDYKNAYYLGNAANPYLVLVETKGRRELSSLTIHEDTEIIAPGAFEGCESLTSITIPENVRVIGQYAFEGCSKLTEITLPFSQWRVINGEAISVCVLVDTEDDKIVERLSEIYYYCTWIKK